MPKYFHSQSHSSVPMPHSYPHCLHSPRQFLTNLYELSDHHKIFSVLQDCVKYRTCEITITINLLFLCLSNKISISQGVGTVVNLFRNFQGQPSTWQIAVFNKVTIYALRCPQENQKDNCFAPLWNFSFSQMNDTSLNHKEEL